jgi:four helix bundle protein
MNAKTKIEASDALADRLARYGAGIIKRTPLLPNTPEGRHVRDQLLRSGTAPGAHYAEARGAQSPKDFLHKLSLALKELRESVHWLGIARYAGYLEDDKLGKLIGEGGELAAILTASQSTARKRAAE